MVEQRLRRWKEVVCPRSKDTARQSARQCGRWKEVVGRRVQQEDGTYSIIPPIPRRRIKHIRRQDATDDAYDIVEIAPEHDCFDLETTGGHFGDERVADCAYCELVLNRSQD